MDTIIFKRLTVKELQHLAAGSESFTSDCKIPETNSQCTHEWISKFESFCFEPPGPGCDAPPPPQEKNCRAGVDESLTGK